jgi:hypothetical protein
MRKMIMRKYGTSRIAQPTGAMNAARTRTDGRLGLRKAKRVKCFASFLTFIFVPSFSSSAAAISSSATPG